MRIVYTQKLLVGEYQVFLNLTAISTSFGVQMAILNESFENVPVDRLRENSFHNGCSIILWDNYDRLLY